MGQMTGELKSCNAHVLWLLCGCLGMGQFACANVSPARTPVRFTVQSDVLLTGGEVRVIPRVRLANADLMEPGRLPDNFSWEVHELEAGQATAIVVQVTFEPFISSNPYPFFTSHPSLNRLTIVLPGGLPKDEALYVFPDSATLAFDEVTSYRPGDMGCYGFADKGEVYIRRELDGRISIDGSASVPLRCLWVVAHGGPEESGTAEFGFSELITLDE